MPIAEWVGMKISRIPNSFSVSALSLVAALGFAACGKATDNTIFEATRDQRAGSLAGRACSKYDSCNDFGTDKEYQTADDCVADYKNKALSMWPSDKCGSGQINDAKFQVCADQVDVEACTDRFWDKVAAVDQCRAATVCSDPRRD